MSIRIAIPEPTSRDPGYNSRALPPYIAALQSCGSTPVLVPAHERQDRVAKLLATTHGVLLPGSRYDVDPERYGAVRIPQCGPADPDRTSVDELLLQDAFNLRKPVLGVCHGAQTLNVWLGGTLIQDLRTICPDAVDHSPGREVVDAHDIRIDKNSRLGELGAAEQKVNSSHHQAIDRLGDRLRVSAFSPQDGVIEAVELGSPEHFVMGIQWHPERTFATNAISRQIFCLFVQWAKVWQPASGTVA
jgi:putative glutamine amidotransferase